MEKVCVLNFLNVILEWTNYFFLTLKFYLAKKVMYLFTAANQSVADYAKTREGLFESSINKPEKWISLKYSYRISDLCNNNIFFHSCTYSGKSKKSHVFPYTTNYTIFINLYI